AAPDTPSGGWTTDGTVYAIAHADGVTYVGGSFTHVGLRTGPGAPFDAADGTLSGSFAEVAGGRVQASAAAPDGSFYIGGDFSTVGGVARPGLARLLPDGSLDQSFAPNLACAPQSTVCTRPAVRALALATTGPDAGTLYLGGTFEKVNATTRNYVAALSVPNAALLSWNPGADYFVDALAVKELPLEKTEPVVFLGGRFATVGGQGRAAGIAAVWGYGAQSATNEGIGGAVTAWNPSWNFLGGTHAIARSIVAGDSEAGADGVATPVYVGGDLPKAGDAHPPFLAAFEFLVGTGGRTASGGQYSYWAPGASCPTSPLSGPVCGVHALALAGSTLYVGGSFTSIGQTSSRVRNGLAALPVVAHPDRTFATNPADPYAWNPSPDAAVDALASDGSNVYAGGEFTMLGDQQRVGLAALPAAADATSAAGAVAWDARVIGPTGPSTLALSGGTLYAGGGFTAARAMARAGLAAFDATGAPTAWDPGADASVRALAVSGGTVYAGGAFASLSDHTGAQPRAHLGAIDAATGTVLPWRADADGWVLALGVAGSTVYAGGAFTAIGNPPVPRSRAAALGAADAVVGGWDPAPDAAVHAISASCGAVYLGGAFTQVAGAPRDRLAAVDPASGAVSSWDPGSNSVVYALSPGGDVVYAGGAFTYAGGQLRAGIAALDVGSGAATAWNPYAQSQSIVRAIALGGDGAVYAGGSFTQIGGASRARLAAIDPVTGAATAWNPSADGWVYALAGSGDDVYAGGEFSEVGGVMQEGFAAFGASPDPATPAAAACPQDRPPVPEPEPVASPEPAGATAGETAHGIADVLAPAIERFALTRNRFRVARRPAGGARVRRRAPVGTAFQLSVSEGGALIIRIDRLLPHRKLRAVGSLERTVAAGRSRIAFSGRVGRRSLAPGRYRATARVTDAAGNVSPARRVRFEVVR
ncbi:MAG: hypothetical protein ACJ76Z_03335, partial [Thermoleophilaceae bacterium]